MTMREGSGKERLCLDVPFPDKEQVKALGALLGGYPLFEDFAHCQSTGVTLPIVAAARVPLDVLYDEGNSEN
jgi:hypothetical protein